MIPRILPALALLVAPAAAQTSTFTGVLEAATTSPCVSATHSVSHNGALMKSSTLDLNQYLGTAQKFTADFVSGPCPMWDVTSVSPATSTLTFCGTPAIGNLIRLRVGPTGVIGQWYLCWSVNPLFGPIDSTLGSVMIAPPFHSLGSGATFGLDSYFEAGIPADPALVGLTIYAQGARHDIGPVGPLELTNPTSFEILPFTGLYILPSC